MRGRASNRSRTAPMQDLQVLRSLLTRIIEELRPEKIWLFGGRAEGRARPDSDYDLLVILSDQAPASDVDLVRAWELTKDWA